MIQEIVVVEVVVLLSASWIVLLSSIELSFSLVLRFYFRFPCR